MVLPRAILCDMPQDVQQKMLDVLDYISANYDTDKLPGEYSVRARSNGKFISDPLSDYRHCPIDQYRKSSVEIVE